MYNVVRLITWSKSKTCTVRGTYHVRCTLVPNYRHIRFSVIGLRIRPRRTFIFNDYVYNSELTGQNALTTEPNGGMTE